MKASILYYQEPNTAAVLNTGKWLASPFNELPQDCFFISNHDSSAAYYFQKNQQIESDQLHISAAHIPFISETEYLSTLSDFQSDFKRKSVEKAIFSRVKECALKLSFEAAVALFHRLCKAYKSSALVYLVSDPAFGTWIGATPEILLKGSSSHLETMALAGTKNTPEKAWSQKEFIEQSLVSEAMLATIQSYPIQNLGVSDTFTVQKGAVFHLCNDIHFDLSSKFWRSLIQDLHPTPAIVGLPRLNARKLIEEYESHDRGFYTGLIGRLSQDELSIYVNLRCLQVLENSLALYLGGGITADSVPQLEWQETEDKAQTLLRLINQ
jgi:isochorismate synthase